MMKTGAAAMLMVALIGTYAFGGVIEFSPADVVVNPGDPTVLTMDLIVAESDVNPAYDSLDAIIGVNGGPQLTGFAWGPWGTRFFDLSEDNDDYYDSGWQIGFFGTAQAAGLTLGTLTVDVTGLPYDGMTYDIVINSDIDGGRSGIGAPPDPITALGTVTLVPEPATLSLLALGAVGLIRRRMTK